METNTPNNSTEDIHPRETNEFDRFDYVDGVLAESNPRQMDNVDTTANSTELNSRRMGFSPVYGLGLILVILVVLSLCNVIYRRLCSRTDTRTRRDSNIERPMHSLPSTPPRFPTPRTGHDTSPKRFGPRAFGFPPASVHLNTTPKRVAERASAESLETFEPWTNYRCLAHPDTPNDPVAQSSSDSTPESEIMRLRERAMRKMSGPFTDGVTRRKLSFPDLVRCSVSDPAELATRRSSISKDA